MTNEQALVAIAASAIAASLSGCDNAAPGTASAEPVKSTQPAGVTSGKASAAADTAAPPAASSAKPCCAGKNECKGKGGCSMRDCS